MPQNKRQHFVPRFYLTRFSKDRKSINIWNSTREITFPNANLRNQCYGDYFYGKDPVVEQTLSTMEGDAAQVLRSIGETSVPPSPGSEDHQLLVFYILTQHGRTLHMADELEDVADKLAKYLVKDSRGPQGIDLNTFRIGFEEPALSALSTVIPLYPLLFDLTCKVLVNKTGTDFVTSDNPVIFYNQLMSFRRHGSNTGVAAKGLEIFLPIDSRHMIVLYDEKVYRVGNDKNKTVYINRNRDAEQLNILQFCSASENIYFRDVLLDVTMLHEKAKNFRSKITSDLQVVETDRSVEGKQRELVRSSRVDINTHLSLTFLTIKFSAKEWRNAFRRMRVQPVTVIRNQRLMDAFEEFEAQVKEGKYTRGQFLEFLQEGRRGWSGVF